MYICRKLPALQRSYADVCRRMLTYADVWDTGNCPLSNATAEVEIMQGCRNAVAGVKVLSLLVLLVQQYKY